MWATKCPEVPYIEIPVALSVSSKHNDVWHVLEIWEEEVKYGMESVY